MSAQTPTPRSREQILGDMFRSFTADTKIRRLKKGSALLSIMEAASRSDARDLQHVFEALESLDLGNAEGPLLASIGADDDVDQVPSSRATTTVTVSDTSFSKISSRVYRGVSAPTAGTTSIAVDDASTAPASGVIYVGRDTPRSEGPLHYSSRTSHAGGYWTFDLAAPTGSFHDWGEEVVVGQGGDRTIDVGQIVQTPQSSLSPVVKFSVLERRVLPDGEVEVTGIRASCTQRGSVGNVPRGAISAWPATPPFPGATVTNPAAVANGLDVEDDDSFRDRIRTVRANKSRGTDQAIEQAVIGQEAPDEDRVIVSADLVRRAHRIANLYVDDGTGYEALTSDVPSEILQDSAAGGEVDFKVARTPVAKAYLQSVNEAPFPLRGGEELRVRVGGTTSTYAVDPDAVTVGAVTAHELAASINADYRCLFSGRTVGGGKYIVIEARSDDGEDLEVVAPVDGATNANDALMLPVGPRYTSSLFVDDRPLVKDFRPASYRGAPFADWGEFSGSQVIVTSVDGTPGVTTHLQDQDFVDLGTGYAVIGKNDPYAWAAVLNGKIPGITVSVDGDTLVLTSNRMTDGASVEVGECDLVRAGLFAAGRVDGVASDYSLDRSSGDLHIIEPLAPGQRLALGTDWPGAFAESDNVPTSTLATQGDAWFAVDGDASVVPHGVVPSTPLVTSIPFVSPHGYRLKLQATGAEAFQDVLAGDWAIVSDPNAPDAFRRAWRVGAVKLDVDGKKNILEFSRKSGAVPRVGHCVTAMATPLSGFATVLVTGGYTTARKVTGGEFIGRGVTAEVELYDPNTGVWTRCAPMLSPRTNHTASLLPDGRVLVAGGSTSTGLATPTCEIYDPIADAWSTGPTLSPNRELHTATTLPNGRVLIAGGRTSGGTDTNSSTEYVPAAGSGSFASATTMPGSCWGHRAVGLTTGYGSAGAFGGHVLICGGTTTSSLLATMWKYDYVAHTWSSRTSMPSARSYHGLALAGGQLVVAFGDAYGAGNRGNYVVYNCVSNVWTGSAALPGNFDCGDSVAISAPYKVIAPYLVNPSATLAHLAQINARFDGTSWTTIPNAPSFLGEYHRVGARAAIVGQNTVVWMGGVSTDNFPVATDPNEKVFTTCSSVEVWDQSTLWSTPDPVVASFTLVEGGLHIVRTDIDLQRIAIPSGVGYTADTLADVISASLIGAEVSTYRTRKIRIMSNSRGRGDLTVAASTLPEALPFDTDTHLPLPAAGASATSKRGDAMPYGFQVFHGYDSTETSVDNDRTVHAAEADYDLTPDPLLMIGEFEEAPPAAGTVTGLRRWHGGQNPAYWDTAASGTGLLPLGTSGRTDPRVSETDDPGLRASIGTWRGVNPDSYGVYDDVVLGLRPGNEPCDWLPHQPFVVAAPYALRQDDDLTVMIDQDASVGRFDISMARKIATTGSYAQQVSVRDSTGDALWKAFGKPYEWEDFALLMRARGVTHSADSTKKVQWRYYRPGADGNRAVVRYDYADAPLAPIEITTTLDRGNSITDLQGRVRAYVDVRLKGGAAKTNTTSNVAARVAVAKVQIGTTGVYNSWFMLGYEVVEIQRTSAGAQTRVRLRVPNPGAAVDGPQGTGISVGETVCLTMVSPSPSAGTIQNGQFVVASVATFNTSTGLQDVFIPINTLHDGSSAMGLTAVSNGNVSLSPAQSIWDPAIVVGDMVRTDDTDHLPVSFTGTTGRIVALGPRYLQVRQLDPYNAGSFTSTGSFTFGLGAGIKVFGAPTDSASAIVAAVNAVTDSPVTGKVTGSGSGTVTLASWDEASVANAGAALSDGVNYVQRTIHAILDTDETQLLLRTPISAAAGDLWTEQDAWLAPILPKQVVQWLQTPAITGLASMARISLADRGQSVAIESLTSGSAGSVQVQGGPANAVAANVVGGARIPASLGAGRPDTCIATVAETAARALSCDSFISVEYGAVDKVPFWNSATGAQIRPTGEWIFGTLPYTKLADLDNLRLHFEKVGDFTAIHVPKVENLNCPLFDGTFAKEWGYVYVAPPTGILVSSSYLPASELPDVNSQNVGVYQVLRYTETPYGVTIWVDAPGSLTEVSMGRLIALTPDSAVPGDIWSVGGYAFGGGNRQDWTIASVGTNLNSVGVEIQYLNTNFFVRAAGGVPAAVNTIFGPDADTTRLVRSAGRLVKKILTITPNQEDPDYSDVQFDTAEGYRAISEAAGARIIGMSKLGFPTTVAVGLDGYSYHGGLLGQANRVVQGDPTDEVTYPGYGAEGARIEPTPARIKRAKVAVALRMRSGASFQDAAERAQAAAAAVINASKVGDADGVGLSAITEACNKIPGVLTSSIVYPDPTTTDRLTAAPGEKLMVLDPRLDVVVSQIGTP